MTKTVKSKDRKIGILVMLTAKEVEFLDRKVVKKDEEKASRSAVVRLLIHKAMEKPGLLDTD